MNKERFDIIASSLSSYFGVGFETVQDQLDIDLGIIPKEFDEDAKKRMALGNNLEDATLNYFEETMGIKIDERNSEMKYAVDGKLKCKRDGRTYLDGVETGWENKVSNAAKCFVDDLGYQIQCQAYMMAFGLDQWVLAGLWEGKPVYKLIKKNEELQKDIEVVVEAVYDILTGITDIDDYPWEIVAKYSSQKQLKNLEETELAEEEKEKLNRLGVVNSTIKELENEAKELKEWAKNSFSASKYEDNDFKYVVTTGAGKESFDKYMFQIEHPEIDLSRYFKKGSDYHLIRVTPKKKKG